MSKNKNMKRIIMKSLAICGEVTEAVVLCAIVLTLSGCNLNSKFGRDSTDYSQACELPVLKLPPGSLAVSKRYDIPDIPGDKDLIITDNMPPDYY